MLHAREGVSGGQGGEGVGSMRPGGQGGLLRGESWKDEKKGHIKIWGESVQAKALG